MNDILHDPDPDEEQLRLISGCLQDAIRDHRLEIPAEVAGVLRFAIIALARLRCQLELSSVPSDELAKIIRTALEYPWLNEQVRNILRDYLQEESYDG
jgi:hypothetical protein